MLRGNKILKILSDKNDLMLGVRKLKLYMNLVFFFRGWIEMNWSRCPGFRVKWISKGLGYGRQKYHFQSQNIKSQESCLFLKDMTSECEWKRNKEHLVNSIAYALWIEKNGLSWEQMSMFKKKNKKKNSIIRIKVEF